MTCDVKHARVQDFIITNKKIDTRKNCTSQITYVCIPGVWYAVSVPYVVRFKTE